MTPTSSRSRSSQSSMDFGLPFRTRKTIVKVYGELSCSNSSAKPSSISPASATTCTSPSSASVTTSASRPFATSSACLPEPPCDWITDTSCPVCAFQCSANSALYASYSSLVGSYETFVISTSFASAVSAAVCPHPPRIPAARDTVRNAAMTFLPFLFFFSIHYLFSYRERRLKDAVPCALNLPLYGQFLLCLAALYHKRILVVAAVSVS